MDVSIHLKQIFFPMFHWLLWLFKIILLNSRQAHLRGGLTGKPPARQTRANLVHDFMTAEKLILSDIITGISI